jgi:hypothetical protein
MVKDGFGNRLIGFTGTREGMGRAQFQQLKKVLLLHAPIEVHHGDCIGSDAQFHDLCRSLFGVTVNIVVHPPNNSKYRAFMAGDTILDPLPYLKRDRNIVDKVQLLIATPRQAMEVKRSGTWATVRYAKKCKKEVVIITPRGHVHHGS